VPFILFDVNVPRPLAKLLTRHTVAFADLRGWRLLTNGDLLAAAEKAAFDVLLTADTNLRYQQNLVGRRIAVVVLSTNAWSVIRAHPAPIEMALDRATPGSYEEVALVRPPLSRRPPPNR
jgi:hypothetical protein